MDIVIPTYGRARRQVTFNNLPEQLRSKVVMVVQQRDWDLNNEIYSKYRGRTWILPKEITTIHQTRKWVFDEHLKIKEPFLFMDDDLVFSARRKDEPTKFRAMCGYDFDLMLGELEELLNTNPMAGVSHREGANRNIQPVLPYGRCMRVWGVNPELMPECVVWGRIPLMEDFDIILQLLRRGIPNPILNQWVHNQGGSDVSGGCSIYRTPELQADCAHKLAELHPGFVKVVQKETKSSWGGGTRTDVTIYWKKAYESSGK